jgi:RNase P subunit RPR2
VDNSNCRICNRPIKEWFLKLTVEDNSGLSEVALVCANCGVKLRLASEKTRDLQIDPWIHEAVANILRGRNR